VVQGFPQALVDSGDHFDIDPQILAQPIGGLQLIKGRENGNLPPQASQALALPAKLAFHIAPTGVQDLKRPTENTLTASQKVGRTTKNGVLSSTHAPVLAHIGCDTP
jgi:hypothetical protein